MISAWQSLWESETPDQDRPQLSDWCSPSISSTLFQENTHSNSLQNDKASFIMISLTNFFVDVHESFIYFILSWKISLFIGKRHVLQFLFTWETRYVNIHFLWLQFLTINCNHKFSRLTLIHVFVFAETSNTCYSQSKFSDSYGYIFLISIKLLFL